MLLFCVSICSGNAQSFVVFYPKKNWKVHIKNDLDSITARLTLVVNGPPQDEHGSLGGYVDQGKPQRGWITPKMIEMLGKGSDFTLLNGIFGLDTEGNMLLLPFDDWINRKPPLQLYWGFQNGPMLLLNGKNLMSPTDTSRSIRSGIGARQNGALVVVVTKEPVTLWELAYILEDERCLNAIYLNGGIGNVGYATQQEWGSPLRTLRLGFYE